MTLTSEQQNSYQCSGYYFPLRVLDPNEVDRYRALFLEYLAENEARLRDLPARKRYLILSQTHTFLQWVYQIVSRERVLDAVESILGPDLLAWDSVWFAKMPRDATFIGWHQDGEYWNMTPPRVVTAWIALTNSAAENGCLRVIPGSHTRGLPHHQTDKENSGLSKGQEIAVEVNEVDAIDVILRPGEMSLHDIGIVHGSKANTSDQPRIGLAVRYTVPEVVQHAPEKPFGLLVRGSDRYGHFELLKPPMYDQVSADDPMREKVMDRLKRTVPLSDK